MVLLYVVLHGSHQYTPNVSIYTSTMDPMGSGLADFSSILGIESGQRKRLDKWQKDAERRAVRCTLAIPGP